jgi:alkylated DNA repair dioxygenase AlkB
MNFTQLPRDGQIDYLEDFLSMTQATALFDSLLLEVDWQPDEVFLLGKHIITKRKVAWQAEEAFTYRYSGKDKSAKRWTESVLFIQKVIESQLNLSFNSCLLNLYHNGAEGMGYHSDNESTMDPDYPIASVSLGAPRDFQFKHNQTKEVISLNLKPGSALVMHPPTQLHWKHQLPIRKRITEPRINLTFRRFVS